MYLKLNVLPDAQFTRKGDDLYQTVPVDLYTALLGGDVGIETMTKPLRMNIPEGSDNSKTFRLKGKGMPKLKNPKEFGDMFVSLQVTLPKHLTDAEKDMFRQIRNMRVAK